MPDERIRGLVFSCFSICRLWILAYTGSEMDLLWVFSLIAAFSIWSGSCQNWEAYWLLPTQRISHSGTINSPIDPVPFARIIGVHCGFSWNWQSK